jgi:hypothetical protein
MPTSTAPLSQLSIGDSGLLSHDAYKTRSKDEQVGNWKVIATSDTLKDSQDQSFSQKGFYAVVYQNVIPELRDQIVISYRGTEFGTVADVKNLLQVALNKLPDHVPVALEFRQAVQQRLQSESLSLHFPYVISNTGHSDGAAMAIVVGAKWGDKAIAVHPHRSRRPRG